MATNRIGSFISPENERCDARQSLLVWVQGSQAVVGMERAAIGFQRDRGLKASRAFAEELNNISYSLATCEDDNFEDDKFIKLDKESSVRALVDLRKIGAALRADLSNEMVDKFRFSGFSGSPGNEGPALTFVEEQNAPIQWEMMYEGPQIDLPEWERFWGFQVPITHWVQKNRTTEIRLRTGLFSAVHEDLSYANLEVARLANRQGLPHRSLKDAFRELVDREIINSANGDSGVASLPRGFLQTQTWLKCFVDELMANAEMPDIERDSWKQKSLVEILNDGFRHDIIHFACHCTVSDETEFLSRLEMKVAGEPICLDVSLMASDLRRQLNSAREPGPLVFLNACGTGQQSASHEPPGFPEKWIDNQGALAVVATLCPVPDHFAHSFALKFYEILLAAVKNPLDPGSTRHSFVAEALLATRRYFMERYDNPLGLAYVLYAAEGVYVLDDFPSGP